MPADDAPPTNLGAAQAARIADVLPHREPFLFVDEIVSCADGKVVATRLFDGNEDFFSGHFPGKPMVPGVILIECMAQAFAFLAISEHGGDRVLLAGVDRARFRRPVRPGDQVTIEVVTEGLKMGVIRGRAVALVAGKKVAEARLSGALDRDSG